MSDLPYVLKKNHEKCIIFEKMDLERNVLISSSIDFKIKVMRLNDLSTISQFNVQSPISLTITDKDKKRIIVGTTNSRIVVLNTIPLAILYNFQIPIQEPKMLWIDPQFKYLIILDKEGTILSLDIDTKQILLKINIPWINSELAQFDKNGRNLFVFSKKNKFYKVRIGTGEIREEFPLELTKISKFEINEETYIMIALLPEELLKIDLKRNKVLLSKKLDKDYEIFYWDNHHGLLILGGTDGQVLILKEDTFEEIESHQICIGTITSIDLAPNGLIYSCGTSIGEIALFPIHKGIDLHEQINNFESIESIYEDDFESPEELNQEEAETEMIELNMEFTNEDNINSNEKANLICSFCGAELKQDGDFCPNCGAPRR